MQWQRPSVRPSVRECGGVQARSPSLSPPKVGSLPLSPLSPYLSPSMSLSLPFRFFVRPPSFFRPVKSRRDARDPRREVCRHRPPNRCSTARSPVCAPCDDRATYAPAARVCESGTPVLNGRRCRVCIVHTTHWTTIRLCVAVALRRCLSRGYRDDDSSSSRVRECLGEGGGELRFPRVHVPVRMCALWEYARRYVLDRRRNCGTRLGERNEKCE